MPFRLQQGSKEIKRTDVRMREKINIVGRIKDVFLHDSSKDALRHIFIWQISVSQMIHLISECFFFNFHLKGMKFGLFVKPYVSNKKLIIIIFLISEVATRGVLQKKVFLKISSISWVHGKTRVLESLFNKVSNLFSPATSLKRNSNTGYRIFLVKFAKFLSTPTLKNICE